MNENIKPAKVNSLSNVNPGLAMEWDSERNGVLSPHEVTYGSKKKVHWVCSMNKDHRWKAAVYSRNIGSGCPYCANQRVSKDNSLAKVNPKLSAEWHPTMNEDKTPSDVLPGSRYMAYWKCKCGYEYKATVNHRTQGTGCPSCSGRVASERNSLSSLRPDLSREFHPTKNGCLTPNCISVFSDKEVWWVCSKGHEWKMSTARRSRIDGCPYCNHQLASREYNLATENPELSIEWHTTKNGSLTPRDVLPYSNKKVYWQCQRKHTYRSTVANRNNGNGCPKCNSKISRSEIRILTEMRAIFPQAKKAIKYDMEIDVYIPEINVGIEYDSYYYHKSRLSKDKEKNEVLSRNNITLVRVRDKGLDKISALDIVLENREIEPDDIVDLLKAIKSNIKLNENDDKLIDDYIEDGEFKNNREYYSMIKDRKLPPRERSLSYRYPELASQLHPTLNNGLSGDIIYAHSGVRYFWRCNNNTDHVWKATADHRSNGTDCPYCYGKLRNK